jgi:hypothetical protein
VRNFESSEICAVLCRFRRLTVAVLASSHNIKALDPIDKVTVVTLKVRIDMCRMCS